MDCEFRRMGLKFDCDDKKVTPENCCSTLFLGRLELHNIIVFFFFFFLLQ